MSNTKHTPGPWLVNDCTRRGSDIGLYRFRISTEEGRDADVVATVPASALGDPVAAADACLIAAAPELLAALRALSDDIEARAYHLDNSTLTALEVARAAIARAEGGSIAKATRE